MVPILDLSLCDEDLVPALHKACSEFGFFYISNHGISSDILERVLSESKRLFDLSLEDKEKWNAKNSPYFRGYTPFSEERLDPKNQVVGDTKEGFYIGAEPKDGADPSQFIGPNQWPSQEDLPGWEQFMKQYLQLCTELGMRLLHLLGKAVALCADEVSHQVPYHFTPHFTNPITLLRLLHYNSIHSKPAEGIFGCGAHTDYGMLTLLLTDDVPALQIYPRAGKDNGEVLVSDDKWMGVPPIPGTFIVNLGDMLQRWSNDKYKSTLHRVVNQTNQERYSIPFFFEPNFDCMVECLPCCVNEGEKPNYEPTTSGQYLLGRYAETHGDYSDNAKLE